MVASALVAALLLTLLCFHPSHQVSNFQNDDTDRYFISERWSQLLRSHLHTPSAAPASKCNDPGAGSNADTNVWAVLVAGSNTWDNYRHQADICHAYHILIGHGVPASQIITLMYDDIAHSRDNPYPGKIFNNPDLKTDVYAGVKIDYSGKDVTPDNFVAVITGDKTGVKGGNGRVLESTANDHVFIYFADHGGSGLIGFPDGVLSVGDLNTALQKMQTKKLYYELTFYMEACESGSMFEGQLKSSQKSELLNSPFLKFTPPPLQSTL